VLAKVTDNLYISFIILFAVISRFTSHHLSKSTNTFINVIRNTRFEIKIIFMLINQLLKCTVQIIFMCFEWFSEQMPIISLYGIELLVFIRKTEFTARYKMYL
jgi:hypothetical protein